MRGWLTVIGTNRTAGGWEVVMAINPRHPAFWWDVWTHLADLPLLPRVYWTLKVIVVALTHRMIEVEAD